MNTIIGRKAIIVLLSAIFVGLLAASLLVGCGEKAPSAAVAIVVDKGATSALADGAEPCVKQACQPVLAGGGHLTVVVASSCPEVVCDAVVPGTDNPTRTALDNRWRKDAFFIRASQIDEVVPSYEEVDLLESLKLAADSLRGEDAQACETRTLYIAASGLSSSGLLDFTGRGKYGNPLEWTDYDELVGRMIADTSSGAIEAEGLPDLSGIHVVWMGFGQLVAGAQAEIPPDRLAAMKDIWSRVLIASGAEFDPAKDFVVAPTSDGTAADRSSLPVVTPVVFPESLAVSTVSFDQNVLGFVENEDCYLRGPEYVEAVLSPYAESLKFSGASIVVLGTTANDGSSKQGCRDLGRRRAERVKGDLVGLGVDPKRIVVASAGYEGVGVRVGDQVVDFYHDNWNQDGSWNVDVAQQNRAIHMIPMSLAEDVLARFGV